MRVHKISLALRYLKGQRTFRAAPAYGRPLFASDEDAAETLRRFTGRDFGTDAKAWGAWLRRNRSVYYRAGAPSPPSERAERTRAAERARARARSLRCCRRVFAMFHGQPYCPACDYQGPEFMWTWHHYSGFGVLLQDQRSLELRVVHVPDDDVFYARDGRTEADAEPEIEAYVQSVVSRQLRPGERHVPAAEFVRLAPAGDDGPPQTDLPCPRCRSPLRWRHTGIS